jgi:magnesium transporter
VCRVSVIGSGVYLDGKPVAHDESPLDAIADARSRGGMVWVGLKDPADDDLGAIASRLGLHPLAVKDCLRGHQRAKLEQFGDSTFIVLQPAHYIDETETVECRELDLFVGPDYVVTVQRDSRIDVDGVRARIEDRAEILEKGPYAVLWAVLETVVSRYSPVLDGVENDIDEIERQLFEREKGVSQRIFSLQREVIDLQHATTPLVDMFDRLQDIVMALTGATSAPAFRELRDKASLVYDRVDGFRHTLDNALVVHATLVEQQNNEEMRRLTQFGIEQNDQVKKISSWAAILFAPTLIGTIYGMNFEYMPELHWVLGYPMAIGMMLTMGGVLYAVFKRRGWL